MISYLKQFLTLQSLFSWRPNPIEAAGLKILLTILVIFLVLAILSKLIQQKNKNDRLNFLAWQKFFYLFLTMGLIELGYLGLAYEGIPYLSAKIWMAVWFLIFLVWLFFATKRRFFTVPKIKKEIKKRKEFERYLP